MSFLSGSFGSADDLPAPLVGYLVARARFGWEPRER
jgi:hypothetical protein